LGREGGKNGKMTERDTSLKLPIPLPSYRLTGICINTFYIKYPFSFFYWPKRLTGNTTSNSPALPGSIKSLFKR
jgi:hypothetical protein